MNVRRAAVFLGHQLGHRRIWSARIKFIRDGSHHIRSQVLSEMQIHTALALPQYYLESLWVKGVTLRGGGWHVEATIESEPGPLYSNNWTVRHSLPVETKC